MNHRFSAKLNNLKQLLAKKLYILRRKSEKPLSPFLCVVLHVANQIPELKGIRKFLSLVSNQIVKLADIYIDETLGKKIVADTKLKMQLGECVGDALQLLRETGNIQSFDKFRAVGEALVCQSGLTDLGSLSEETLSQMCNREIVDVYQYITPKEQDYLVNCFVDAFYFSLRKYAELNWIISANTMKELKKDMRYLEEIDRIGFIEQLGCFGERDGMFRQLYQMFRERFVIERPKPQLLAFLTRIQVAYNAAYDVYNHAHARVVNTSLIISDIVGFHREDTSALVQMYLDFVCADCYYFAREYDNAISSYQNVKQFFEEHYHRTMRCYYEIKTYLLNSIAWSYEELATMHRDDQSLEDAYIKKALAAYEEMIVDCTPEKMKDCPFIAKYKRNYGSLLEKKEEFDSAIEQYRQAIEYLDENSVEYKLYITFSSCIMKKWDAHCKRSSLEWADNVRCAERGEDQYRPHLRLVDRMISYLTHALRKNGDYSDAYYQRAKARMYEMLIKGWKDDALLREIDRDLIMAERLAGKREGYLHVKRDLLYALYLLTCAEAEKETYLNECEITNKRLSAGKDKDEFDWLIKRIRCGKA